MLCIDIAASSPNGGAIILMNMFRDWRARPKPIPVMLVNIGCEKGARSPAQNENESERPATFQHSLAVVLNVFCHREAQPDHRGINDAIDHAVKFILLPEEENKEDQCLGALFDYRSGNDCAKRMSGALALLVIILHCYITSGIYQEGEEHRHERAPKESGRQHPSGSAS